MSRAKYTLTLGGSTRRLTLAQAFFAAMVAAPVVVFDPTALVIRSYDDTSADAASDVMRSRATLDTILNSGNHYGQWNWEGDGYADALGDYLEAPRNLHTPQSIVGAALDVLVQAFLAPVIIGIAGVGGYPITIGFTDDHDCDSGWTFVESASLVRHPAKPPRMPFE